MNYRNRFVVAVWAVVLCVAPNLYATQEQMADILVYSFDRPMQLYAFLESVEEHVETVGEIHVVYRASSAEYQFGYDMVKSQFPRVIYAQQSETPLADFKPLTLQAVFGAPSAYIVFAVDDIIVTDHIRFADDIELLEQYNAYGFYYRLGSNLSHCYSMNEPQALPPLTKLTEHVYSWNFSQGQHDWGYPNTVDMTLYRKADIRAFFEYGRYNTPNTLEARWATQAYMVANRIGLCYEHSKIVNLPLNRVQNDFPNRAMSIKPQDLLESFNQGLKIDRAPLWQIRNKSAHMEYEPTFIAR